MTEVAMPLRYLAQNVVAKLDGSAGVPYIGLENVEPGTGCLARDPDTSTTSGGCQFTAGDVLYGKLRPYLRKVWRADFAGVASSEFLNLRADPSRLDPKYLSYVMLSSPMSQVSVANSYGAKMPRTNWDEVGGFKLRLPPLEEQRRIADMLDRETDRIDTLVAKNRQVLDLLGELEVALVAAPFSGRLRLDSTGVPVGLTGHECVPLYTLGEVRSGLTRNAALEDSQAASWPYLRVANVQDGHADLQDLKTVSLPPDVAQQYRLRAGDVLMTEGGDPDKLGRGTVWEGSVDPCLHQNHVFAVRVDHERVLPEYLALATRAPYGRAYFEATSSKTTGIASTSTTKVGRWRVPLPSMEAQVRVASTAEREVGALDRLRERVHTEISLLQERREALVTAAVTGESDV